MCKVKFYWRHAVLACYLHWLVKMYRLMITTGLMNGKASFYLCGQQGIKDSSVNLHLSSDETKYLVHILVVHKPGMQHVLCDWGRTLEGCPCTSWPLHKYLQSLLLKVSFTFIKVLHDCTLWSSTRSFNYLMLCDFCSSDFVWSQQQALKRGKEAADDKNPTIAKWNIKIHTSYPNTK